MPDAEHECTLSHLDSKYRKTLEDHWKALEMTQDDDDSLLGMTAKSYSQTGSQQGIKQKLAIMIDRILGVPRN